MAAVVAGSVWRHLKRGTLYVVEDLSRFQCGFPADLDDTVVVHYRGENGQPWSRPLAEFTDGRFEYVGAFPWLFDQARRVRVSE